MKRARGDPGFPWCGVAAQCGPCRSHPLRHTHQGDEAWVDATGKLILHKPICGLLNLDCSHCNQGPILSTQGEVGSMGHLHRLGQAPLLGNVAVWGTCQCCGTGSGCIAPPHGPALPETPRECSADSVAPVWVLAEARTRLQLSPG